MGKRYVIALDQGTTSSRSMLIDEHGRAVGCAQREFPQIYPQPGWVDHDPKDIAASQLGTFTELMTQFNLTPDDIECIGITNQRETTIIWDRATGEPVANAIVWQCRRTAQVIQDICGDSEEVREQIVQRTGLRPDPYFSASKVRWLLDNVPGARERAERGELAFGTVDSWLVWNLTNGRVHATDPTNASRTMLFNIHTGEWDPYLLELFGIPASMMPEVRPSSSSFGATANPNLPLGIPICGVAGDQQAALFGQCCFNAGQAKNTYGTGCFFLMNTGQHAPQSKNNLVTTIAASAPGQPRTYALEGSVFVAGALVQWLRDSLGLISSAQETEALALSVPDNAGVYIVPAFTGLGAPYWDSDARGAIYGLTRGATRAHIARAALESMAYQMHDLAVAMEADAGFKIETLNVDGGAARNDFLLQFQSDVLGTQVRRPANTETTALGAAYLAGLCTGYWKSTDELAALRGSDEVFTPQMPREQADQLLAGWKDAVRRTLSS
ncbi:MAG: glycerol kinase GlpK [Coriobacteriales bacterium]